MTDNPCSCSNCADYSYPIKDVPSCDHPIYGKHRYLSNEERESIRCRGCLSHPKAREYLMEGVIEELLRIEGATVTSVFERNAYRKAINIIKNGVEK